VSDVTNEDRMAWALGALKAFRAECRGSPLIDADGIQEAMRDLIANFGHLARAHDLDFKVIMERAFGCWIEEEAEDEIDRLVAAGKPVEAAMRSPKVTKVTIVTDTAQPDRVLYSSSRSALRAVYARIQGIWDDPDLQHLGPLSTNQTQDILTIIAGALANERELEWEPIGTIYNDDDPTCALKGKDVVIADCNMHLMAIAVDETGDGVVTEQNGADGVEELYDDLRTFQGGADGPFETTDIDGRKYVVWAAPFAG
jgi:hypothetical protein